MRTLALASLLVLLLSLAAPILLFVEVNNSQISGPIEKPPCCKIVQSPQLLAYLNKKGVSFKCVTWATPPYVSQQGTTFMTIQYKDVLGKEIYTKYVIMAENGDVLYECDVTD
jgi:hypothetical protein